MTRVRKLTELTPPRTREINDGGAPNLSVDLREHLQSQLPQPLLVGIIFTYLTFLALARIIFHLPYLSGPGQNYFLVTLPFRCSARIN